MAAGSFEDDRMRRISATNRSGRHWRRQDDRAPDRVDIVALGFAARVPSGRSPGTPVYWRRRHTSSAMTPCENTARTPGSRVWARGPGGRRPLARRCSGPAPIRQPRRPVSNGTTRSSMSECLFEPQISVANRPPWLRRREMARRLTRRRRAAVHREARGTDRARTRRTVRTDGACT
jgi:hypothetical protein